MQLDPDSISTLKTVIKGELADVVKAAALSTQSSTQNMGMIAELKKEVSDLRQDIRALEKEQAKASIRWGIVSVLSSLFVAALLNISVKSVVFPNASDSYMPPAIPPKEISIDDERTLPDLG